MTEEQKPKKEECLELKNIKYQTMLLNNNTKIYETTPNTSNIERFLEKELEMNINKPWTKLGNGTKLKKINQYILEYSKEKEYTQILQKLLQKVRINPIGTPKILVYNSPYKLINRRNEILIPITFETKVND